MGARRPLHRPASSAWRRLPHRFTVSWSAAHKHFLRWCRAGICTRILTAIARRSVQEAAGAEDRPPRWSTSPTNAHVWVDNTKPGATATAAAAKAGVTVDDVSGPKPVRGFTLPATPLGRRTHQWLHQPLLKPRPALQSHPHARERFPSSAKSPTCSDDSTDPNCSTNSRGGFRRRWGRSACA